VIPETGADPRERKMEAKTAISVNQAEITAL